MRHIVCGGQTWSPLPRQLSIRGTALPSRRVHAEAFDRTTQTAKHNLPNKRSQKSRIQKFESGKGMTLAASRSSTPTDPHAFLRVLQRVQVEWGNLGEIASRLNPTNDSYCAAETFSNTRTHTTQQQTVSTLKTDQHSSISEQRAAQQPSQLQPYVLGTSEKGSPVGRALSLLEQSREDISTTLENHTTKAQFADSLMTPDPSKTVPADSKSTPTPAQHRPLVVGLTKKHQSQKSTDSMTSTDGGSVAAALNKEIEANVRSNVSSAAPAGESSSSAAPPQPKKKQAKPQKATPPTAPTSPALIDLRVGHILRAIAHPNADSLYVSTIAMGDPEGTEHTEVDETTGKVVRTVCSGLRAYISLEEMQDRKIVVVANLKPVNMRSIKSAAMVLAASPKQPEGADPHAADRTVELVAPPAGAEAGEPVFFEGWPYGEGKGPEKVLNPKKKQWEAIQPGFFTTDDLKVAFDAGVCADVSGDAKGDLIVAGKGSCTVQTLVGAVVR